MVAASLFVFASSCLIKILYTSYLQNPSIARKSQISPLTPSSLCVQLEDAFHLGYGLGILMRAVA
jgi:hypothetical protein